MPAMNLPPFTDYSDDAPERFYLGAADAHGAPDAEFSIEGRALPIHSAVLAPQSRVLRDVFPGQHAAAAGRTAPLPIGGNGLHLLDHSTQLLVVASDSIILAREEQSLVGYTLKRVTHFLRFVYHPEQIGQLDFELPGAAKTLSACARLAHQLDMPALLDRLDKRMEEAVSSHQPTLQRLMDWASVAEDCGLRRLWTKCVREIAVTLAGTHQGCTVRTTSSNDLAGSAAVAELRATSAPSSQELAARLRSASLSSSAGSLSPTGSDVAARVAALGKGGAASPVKGLAGADPAKTAAHDVTLLRVGAWQTLSSKSQLAVMSALLAGLRTAGGDPAALVPQEASLGAALPTIWKLRSTPGSPAGELA